MPTWIELGQFNVNTSQRENYLNYLDGCIRYIYIDSIAPNSFIQTMLKKAAKGAIQIF